MTIRPWNGTIEDSAIQVRHDGRELRIIAHGETAAVIEGELPHLRALLATALARLDNIVGEMEEAEDDGEPAVCVYCGMLLEWHPRGEGWVALRWVTTAHAGDGFNVEEPICTVAHVDGNLHRPITPAERAARERACVHCHAIVQPDDIAGWVAVQTTWTGYGIGHCPANPDSINHETPEEIADEDDDEACPACGDPEGPCEIGCEDPDCTSRDCESHDACEPLDGTAAKEDARNEG